MEIHNSKTRRSLQRIAGVALMMSCAAGIAASLSIPGGGPGKWNSLLARDTGTDPASGSAESVSALMDRDGVSDTPPAARPGEDKGAEDAEIAALLGWHLTANNVYGASDAEDMPHSR